MRVRARSVLSPLAPLFFAACSSAPPPPPPTPTPPPPPPGPTIQTPASWAMRPPTEALGQLALGREGTLHFGAGGDRWLVEPGSKKPKFATTFAKEPIAAGRKLGDGSYRFVTSSGAIHDAPSALGALSAARVAPKTVRSVALGKQAVVAIERARVLVRSLDGGQKWSPVTLPAVNGVLAQVELGEDGTGLVLVSPQKLLATSDDGATWKEVAAPAGLGPAHLKSIDGKVLIGSPTGGTFRFDGATFQRASGAAPEMTKLPAVDHPNTAWAQSVASSRAALVDDKLYELVWDEESDTGGHKLFVSELGKPESQKALRSFGCATAYLGASDKTLVVGCNGPLGPDGEKMPDDASTLIYRSDDAGATFKPDGWVSNAGRSDERLWVGPDGTVIYKNVCPQGASCSGSGSVRLAGSATWSELQIEGGASLFALTFGPQGSVYAVGSASDDEGYRKAFLFVSRDNGKKFTRVALPEPSADELDAMRPSGGYGGGFGGGYGGYTDRAGAISLGDDGKLAAVAVSYQGAWRLYGTTDDGGSMALRTLPPSVGVGFAGHRGYALGAGKAWETFDAGQTWKTVAGPGLEGGAAVSCSAVGCLVGANVARVGWDLTAARGDYAPEKAPAPKQVFRTPLDCKAEGSWVEVAGRGDVTYLGVELGGLWAVPITDEETKGLSVAVYGTDPKKGTLKVDNVTLLAGQPKPKTPAAPAKDGKAAPPQPTIGTRIGLVPGGVIAMRWKIDHAARKKAEQDKKPTPLADVEVAWWSSATKKVSRGKIAKVVDRDASFELLGVTDKGAVISRSYPTQGAKLWVVGAGKTEELPLPFKPGGASTRTAARIDNKLVIQQYTGWAGLEWWWEATKDPKAKPAKDAPPPPAWESGRLMLWADSSVGGMPYPRATPLGADALLFAWGANPAFDAGSFALRVGPKADATVVPGPTQLGVADKACGKGAQAPAAQLAYATGSRHPLTLSIEGKSVVTATADAIVRVTADGAGCLAGRLMERSYQAGQLDAYVPATEGEKGIVLRRDWKKLEAAQLVCTPKPGPLPASLEGRDGFVE